MPARNPMDRRKKTPFQLEFSHLMFLAQKLL
jgi:hypothetical protein